MVWVHGTVASVLPACGLVFVVTKQLQHVAQLDDLGPQHKTTMILHSGGWDGFICVHESEKAHSIRDGPFT